MSSTKVRAEPQPRVRHRERAGLQCDIRPPQARDLAATQTRQRELPRDAVAVVGDVRQQLLQLGRREAVGRLGSAGMRSMSSATLRTTRP